ncbi:unnamed protein product [Protopolystoma xenopodis]|uniref:Uncharacterized protein n=1 Tax=Protopolystoma xenopodis TaxID=117903 RepID=A0A3S5CD41_9PLAT|nr:unnamed protein product [Protopolystoma xenopodis]
MQVGMDISPELFSSTASWAFLDLYKVGLWPKHMQTHETGNSFVSIHHRLDLVQAFESIGGADALLYLIAQLLGEIYPAGTKSESTTAPKTGLPKSQLPRASPHRLWWSALRLLFATSRHMLPEPLRRCKLDANLLTVSGAEQRTPRLTIPRNRPRVSARSGLGKRCFPLSETDQSESELGAISTALGSLSPTGAVESETSFNPALPTPVFSLTVASASDNVFTPATGLSALEMAKKTRKASSDSQTLCNQSVSSQHCLSDSLYRTYVNRLTQLELNQTKRRRRKRWRNRWSRSTVEKRSLILGMDLGLTRLECLLASILRLPSFVAAVIFDHLFETCWISRLNNPLPPVRIAHGVTTFSTSGSSIQPDPADISHSYTNGTGSHDNSLHKDEAYQASGVGHRIWLLVEPGLLRALLLYAPPELFIERSVSGSDTSMLSSPSISASLSDLSRLVYLFATRFHQLHQNISQSGTKPRIKIDLINPGTQIASDKKGSKITINVDDKHATKENLERKPVLSQKIPSKYAPEMSSRGSGFNIVSLPSIVENSSRSSSFVYLDERIPTPSKILFNSGILSRDLG